MKSLTKDEIKDRLIRRAAETWGVDDIEVEYSFDPIVSILFDACSHEFERISDEIKSSRTKITERLVDLLTPEVAVSAKPSHAIMHALPLDTTIAINERTQFYYRKKLPIYSEDHQKKYEDFFFGPAGNFNLNNSTLKYIAYPTKIATYENHRTKPFITEKKFNSTPNSPFIYIAIKPGEEAISLDQMLCYFDLLNFSQKELLAHQIGISSWSVNNTPIKVVKGYNEQSVDREDFSAYINESIQSKIKFYENYVKQFYENHFYTINSSIPIKENLKQHPDEFKKFLSKDELDKFDEPLIWIKISFSSIVSNAMLENLYCHINCFPVLNKKIHTINKRLQPYFNIIPLEVENDYFFDVNNITGDNGSKYYVNNRENNEQKEDEQLAFLRFSGVSRFDERDASELLNYTLDLLKADSVAFSAMNSEFISSNLKDLKQIVSRIEQQIEISNFNKSKIPYLIINKKSSRKNKDQNIFANYWSTAGEKANKINPFVTLSQYSGTGFNPDTLNFITGSIGGRDEPTPSEKIYAYRENILSKGRIITKQDIIQHCCGIYKEAISNISVEKGVMVSNDQSVGYTPTMDINIYKNENSDYSEEDWNHLKKEVIIGLETRSTNVLPFRIFYKQK